jgi:tubulin polyglutamylase TTLL9
MPTVRWRCHYRNTVYDVISARQGWREMPRDEGGHYTDSTDWDIVWTDRVWAREYMHQFKLREGQRVNHFRNNYELCRKDNMVKNLKRARKQLEKDGRLQEAANFDFFPTTYTVPQEYGLFYEEFKRHPESTWIMKPVGSAQGRGIFLFTKLSQISDWKSTSARRLNVGGAIDSWSHHASGPKSEDYVAQKYIDNPYLVGGKKFDLRCVIISALHCGSAQGLGWPQLMVATHAWWTDSTRW